MRAPVDAKNLPASMSVQAYREMLASGAIAARRSPGKKPAKRVKVGAGAGSLTEEALHRQCFSLIEAMTPKHPILKFMAHVPNGGARSAGEGGKLKAMGVRKGIPDFILPKHRGRWSGLAIEIKSKDGKLSPDQCEWMQSFFEEGYLTSVCRTVDDFERLVLAYLDGQSAPDCVEWWPFGAKKAEPQTYPEPLEPSLVWKMATRLRKADPRCELAEQAVGLIIHSSEKVSHGKLF